MDTDTTTNTDCLPLLAARGVAFALQPSGPGVLMPVFVWTNQASGRTEPFVTEIERTPDGYRRLVQKNTRYAFGQPESVAEPVAASRPVSASGRRRALLFLLGWLISVILLLAFFSLVRWLAL